MLFHLTESSNLDSIRAHGLRPSRILSPSHREAIGRKKAVYTWRATTRRRDRKLVADMIYCKQFLHPRHMMMDRLGWDYIETHFIPWPRPLLYAEDYTLLAIDESRVRIHSEHLHDQQDLKTLLNTAHGLDSRYSHKAKQTVILTHNIPWSAISVHSEYRAFVRGTRLHVRLSR